MYAKMIIFMLPLTFIIGIVTFIPGTIAWIYNSKLFLYIKRNYPIRYQSLWGNALSGYGDPITNFLIIWRYFYNNLDEEDEVIKNYKNIIRKSGGVALILLLITTVLILILFLLTYIGGYWGGTIPS